MFPWNIAKSAEAIFSRWAVKRLCKFLLKKKLGQFILGEIDLDQLDVQLSAGTIQLADLALNVDFLNEKFGDLAAVIIKEGSIGSLSITMPWKGKGCQIEVDELELVLAPNLGSSSNIRSETCVPREDGKLSTSLDSRKPDNEQLENAWSSASLDVHEGVKTIAKMVKLCLTSFHVKVKQMIVAFDACTEANENHIGFYRTLVLRITEVECGTCISEEVSLEIDVAADNFLGLSQLTNFIKFQGAVLEFLHSDAIHSQTSLPFASGSSFGEWFSTCPSGARTPVVTGQRGGFSGTLKLSIPWKNGSLDIRKVNADIHIDPLELRFQPRSLGWFLYLWEVIKISGEKSKVSLHCNAAESVYFNAASHCFQSTSTSCAPTDKMMPCNGRFPADVSFTTEKVPDVLLPESHLISDWVPFTFGERQKDGIEEEPDFGASVERFFECFDGMRSSQSALGNSGMWNWTCSFFSAITAASNLASGSLQIPSDQQHVETNLNATIAGISVLLSLLDDDQQHSCGLNTDYMDVGSNVHYICANCQDIQLALQVCTQQMKFKATVEQIEVTDYFSNVKGPLECDLHQCGDSIESQMAFIQQVQAAVQDALPPLSVSAKDAETDKPSQSVDADFPFETFPTKRCISRSNCRCIYRDDVVKVSLFRTSGATQFQLTVNSSSFAESFMGSTSFSLKLPEFVFWVNFNLINMVLGLFRELRRSFEMDSMKRSYASKGINSEPSSSFQQEVEKNSCPHLTALSTEERLRGNIFLPKARIILCFPIQNDGDFRSYTSWNQFLVLDLSPPLSLHGEKVPVMSPVPVADSQKRYSLTASQTLHLNMGNLDIYFISSLSNSSDRTNSCGNSKEKHFIQNIVSASGGPGQYSVVTMLWREGAVTGPWIAKRAKLLATSEDLSGRNRFMGKGYRFASVTTVKDMDDSNNHAREEIILSSALFLHAQLPPVTINLNSSEYEDVHSLLHQVIDWFSCIPYDSVGDMKEARVNQTSVLLECDSAEIFISLRNVENVKGPIQSELPGSWYRLKLQIHKFDLLSVSNVGGIYNANFLWIAHGEGNLWGSITGVPDQEFVLISCSNSTTGRGDGEGSNILSSKLSGTDIVHLWDPEVFHIYTCITVRCCTIVAKGGRLDWFGTIGTFFSLPSSESEHTGDTSLQEGNSAKNELCGSSFVLNLVDVGLSYEPYLKNLMVSDVCKSDSNSREEHEEIGQYFAGLLAASSLKLSSISVADCVDSEYKVRVQDLGLLVCAISEHENVSSFYSAEHLHKFGYVKVATEAHVEAILRTNCKNGLLWELECPESHIFLDTCHDTTFGLICLAAQLQQIYAPDVEESIVHLQTRWNNVQQAQATHINTESSMSTSQGYSSCLDVNGDPSVVNWMDEICEDAFDLDSQWDIHSGFSELRPSNSLDDASHDESCAKDTQNFSCDLSFAGAVPMINLETGQTSVMQKSFPEVIEGYFLSELSPLSEVSNDKLSSNEMFKGTSQGIMRGDVEKLSNRWYEDASLKVVEDHVSGASKEASPLQHRVGDPSRSNCNKLDCGNVRGRVICKNINVFWRMYAGSDWHEFQEDVQHPPSIPGRDRTVCLELALYGLEFRYDVYPEGDICISRLSFSVQDFHLNDRSKDAPWKLVLGYYHSQDHPRKSSSKAFKLDLEAVRPDPLTPLEEYRLRMMFLPMLLHLHQSQLDFLICFFGGKNPSIEQSTHAVKESAELKISREKSGNCGGHTINEEALLTFFQKFDMWPVRIRVDYIPHRLDLAALRGGKYVELVNLVPWKGVELQLKHVHAVGVYGWSSVCETIIGEWLEDISQNQIHKLLQGLPPIRSLVAVGTGTAKLVSLPVKNYRKDNRVLKGMQRGTIAFLRSVSLEAVGLGVHLAASAHDILLHAEYILASIPPSVPWPVQSRIKTNLRSNQPKDAKQGIQQAYESISDGLGKSASALVRTPLKRYQHGAGVSSALVTAVQAAPAAAIAPASAAARAVHCALLGVRNSLDPEHKKESFEKYLGPTQPWENVTGD